MSYADEMWAAYKDIIENAPLYDNPFLDESFNQIELLIVCRCYANYRIMANNILVDNLDIHCRNCGRSISEARSYSQHSGGVFNSTMFRFTDKERAVSQTNGT